MAPALIAMGATAFGEETNAAPEVDGDATICQSMLGDADALLKACTNAIAAEIRDSGRRQAIMLGFRALAWKGKGDLEHAAVDLTEAIGLAPDFAPAHESRGDLLRDN